MFDLMVTRKEEVKQPHESEFVIDANIIEAYPIFDGDCLVGLEATDNEAYLRQQMCDLVCIWQQGLDPLDVNDGNRWTQALLGEISILHLMDDIKSSVASISRNVDVVFDTQNTENGTVLKFKVDAGE